LNREPYNLSSYDFGVSLHAMPSHQPQAERTTNSAFMLQKGGPPAPASSRLAAAGFYLLKIHDRMAGKFLPFAGVGKQTIHFRGAADW